MLEKILINLKFLELFLLEKAKIKIEIIRNKNYFKTMKIITEEDV